MFRKSNMSVLMIMLMSVLSISSGFSNGQSDEESGKDGDAPILEVWWAGESQFPAETGDNPFIQRTIDELGVGWERPTVSWNSGNDYGEKLKLRLAAGDPPDIFRLPNFGFSAPEMAAEGLAADLTDLLPELAPTIYSQVPEEMWNAVRFESPDKNSLYYIPALRVAPTHGAFIRKDWLDRMNLDIPATEEEFHDVLRAFRDQDANGNGDPADEIPTGGRGPGRWWDHLFTPYGVAMFEGFPSWDYYDGKIQYSAVQPEMKQALKALRMAYKEGLIDPEILVNKANTWDGKLKNDQVGVYFHMPIYLLSRTTSLYGNFPEAEMIWLPPYRVEGVDAKWSEGYVASPNTSEKIIIANSDETTVRNALRLLEHLQKPETIEANIWGIEGLHYTVKDGMKVKRTDNIEEQKAIPNRFSTAPPVSTVELYKNNNNVAILGIEDSQLKSRLQNTDSRVLSAAKVITVPGSMLPLSIYDGYPDIATHKLYFSTMAKIIIGELDLDAFDSFVEQWYATGGTEVTAKAQQAAHELKL